MYRQEFESGKEDSRTAHRCGPILEMHHALVRRTVALSARSSAPYGNRSSLEISSAVFEMFHLKPPIHNLFRVHLGRVPAAVITTGSVPIAAWKCGATPVRFRYCPSVNGFAFVHSVVNLEGFLAPPAGFEPTAPGLGILCSIHLS
jgi:hypothetical protein